MAITRAQQVRQMLREGSMKPVKQAGVINYMPSEMVTVPKIAKSSPNTPTAKLAYITPEEQDILIDLNLYGSLDGKPNRGPGGIPSLEGDFGGGFGSYEGGADFGGASDDKGNRGDFSDFTDTGTGNYVANDSNVSIQEQREREREQREKEQREKEQKEKEQRDQAIKNAQAKKVMDRRKRMGAKYVTDMFDLPADYDEEKDDTAAMLDLFVNDPYREDRTKRTLPTPLGMGLSLLEKPLQAGAKKTRQFFSGPTTDIFGRKQKGVLAAGKFNYKGEPLTEERFAKMSLTEKNQAYKDYMGQRLDNQIDAYGNPLNQGDDGPDNTILFPQNTTPGDGDDSEDDDDTNTGGLNIRFRKDGGRINAMDGGMMSPEGGIMDLETGRQMYFLGKLVKKATRAVKKITKSPLGKAALVAGLGIYGGGGFGVLKNKGLSALASNFFSKSNPLLFDAAGKLSMGKLALASAASPFLFGQEEEDEEEEFYRGPSLDIARIRNNPYDFRARRFAVEGGIMRTGLKDGISLESILEGKIPPVKMPDPLERILKNMTAEERANFELMMKINASRMPKYKPDPNAIPPVPMPTYGPDGKRSFAEGGDVEPVAKKTMPLLDMGGKEMDLRDDGGFVPLGRMERADDVPARLSKNEFVFTADAVRNAGEGDVDKGAEVMYNMMKNLESGGEVSEESQGLSGAREMFQTSKRLEEVL